MKNKILFLLISFSVLYSSIYAQNTLRSNTEKETQTFERPRPVHAGEYLQRFYKATGFNPDEVIPAVQGLKKAAFNFQKGTPITWKAANFLTNSYYDVQSKCQFVGTNCYVFVENAIWGVSANDNGIQKVAEAFDSKTPLNNGKGIYQNNTEIFGMPPNVDGDTKIIILILDIKDDFDGQPGSGYVAGYFSSTNELPKIQTEYSNQAEIYYLDGVQNDLTTERGLQDAMSTTAHEFQHMIHHQYFRINKSLEPATFYNEMCSLSAEFMNGYPLYSQARYTNESNKWLENWRNDNNVLTDYSRAAKLGRYLYEQFDTPLFTRYLFNGVNGITGLNKALTDLSATRKMADILPDWFMANLINDKSVNPNWGYSYQPISLMNPRIHKNPNVSVTDTVQALSVQYISFTGGKNLTFSYNNYKNTKVKAVAFKYDESNSLTYTNVDPNINFTLPEFGTSIPKVIFAIYNVDTSPLNLSAGAKSRYSYTATGEFETSVQELAHDTGEPDYAQVAALVGQDSIAVVFDGISGYKLDSIRVALRQAGSMNGGIWKYSGVLQPTPLGQKLTSLAAISTIAVRPQANPYPIPYNNWVTVDLRGSNISASQSFAVGFVMAGVYDQDGYGDNRVMVDEAPGTSPYPSVTYLQNPTEGSPRWVYIVGTGTVNHYLIRAYVSLITDAKEVVELLPSAFTLEQNYPNPFNPSTIISYNLPKASNVQIRIFDALGREVRSLLNEEKNAGKFSVLWDSRDNSGHKVSSGIYFYKIIAGDFIQTKKMILVK